MPILISSYPSPTAIISRCPQCRAVANISLIEPDLEPLKERHTFACEECGSSYIYLIDRTAPAAGHAPSWRPLCATISQDGNSGDPAEPFGPSVASKVLSDSSVDKAAVKYQAYSRAMPFSANSFFAFSFLAKCIRPMPRSTLGALVN
jgi:predicted RNA-binding Zn-ribbon protein involved in translation (DUF1610 family)